MIRTGHLNDSKIVAMISKNGRFAYWWAPPGFRVHLSRCQGSRGTLKMYAPLCCHAGLNHAFCRCDAYGSARPQANYCSERYRWNSKWWFYPSCEEGRKRDSSGNINLRPPIKNRFFLLGLSFVFFLFYFRRSSCRNPHKATREGMFEIACDGRC